MPSQKQKDTEKTLSLYLQYYTVHYSALLHGSCTVSTKALYEHYKAFVRPVQGPCSRRTKPLYNFPKIQIWKCKENEGKTRETKEKYPEKTAIGKYRTPNEHPESNRYIHPDNKNIHPDNKKIHPDNRHIHLTNNKLTYMERIAIDMGGTNLRAALVTEAGIRHKVQAPCPAQGTEDEVLEALCSLIDPLAKEAGDRLEGIGAGIPSVIDREQGIVYDVANIPSWRCVLLGKALSERFACRVALDNDSNCFTLGEARYGAGRDYRHFVGVTLGTGLGAGVVIDGRMCRGEDDGVGEIGCIPYLDSDVEHYCSSHYFAEKHHTTAGELSALARQGDTAALAAWDDFGHHIGQMVKIAMFAYAPEALILGGGIARSLDLFEKTMYEEIARFPFRMAAKRMHVWPSCLADAALLGAASLLDE